MNRHLMLALIAALAIGQDCVLRGAQSDADAAALPLTVRAQAERLDAGDASVPADDDASSPSGSYGIVPPYRPYWMGDEDAGRLGSLYIESSHGKRWNEGRIAIQWWSPKSVVLMKRPLDPAACAAIVEMGCRCFGRWLVCMSESDKDEGRIDAGTWEENPQ